MVHGIKCKSDYLNLFYNLLLVFNSFPITLAKPGQKTWPTFKGVRNSHLAVRAVRSRPICSAVDNRRRFNRLSGAFYSASRKNPPPAAAASSTLMPTRFQELSRREMSPKIQQNENSYHMHTSTPPCSLSFLLGAKVPDKVIARSIIYLETEGLSWSITNTSLSQKALPIFG